jgi:hypothetical protein
MKFSHLTLIAALFLFTTSITAATYQVGPGQQFANINDVAWESLQPGDTVLIHWRSTPYKEKWVLGRQGTSTSPIIIRGVPGPEGQLPVIDGNGAATRRSLNYWSETRGVIKIGGSNIPSDTVPKYINIENLDIRSARPPYTFTADDGTTQSYTNNASSIYIEKGENITIRNCILHDSGNGFFVASSDAVASREILVEGNYIYDNGNVNSLYEHNNYTAAVGITFQYNRFGPLRAGCSGNNLKDRSAGAVIRYNWIEGGNRQLDLVDGEDSLHIRGDARYSQTLVYGNVLIEPDMAGNRQIVHYGGDSGNLSSYRKGTLYFYNNTVVSTRTDRTTLFRLSSNDETCDARNNIFYVRAAGNTLSYLDSSGVLNLSHNWLKPGAVNTFGTLTGAIYTDGTSRTGDNPGFTDEAGQLFNLTESSACINAGGPLHSALDSTKHPQYQYVKHQRYETRSSDGVLDIGAFEGAATVVIPPIVVNTTSLAEGRRGRFYSQTLQASGGLSPYTWSIAGTLPTGLRLSSTTGAIQGTPTKRGTWRFTVNVVDSSTPKLTASRQLSITIR